jgi:hypothetical protein
MCTMVICFDFEGSKIHIGGSFGHKNLNMYTTCLFRYRELTNVLLNGGLFLSWGSNMHNGDMF